MTKSILETISEIDELLAISQFLKDPKLDEALSNVVKLTVKPGEVNATLAMNLVLQMQAVAFICKAKAMYYTNIEPGKAGSDNYKRKNAYYTLGAELKDLVDALKYPAKMG